jgi:L-asparaginase II
MPLLEPDQQRLLEAFFTLNKTRPLHDGWSGKQSRLRLADVRAGWEISGWQAMGMPLDEFVEWMLELDHAYISFWSDRRSRENK